MENLCELIVTKRKDLKLSLREAAKKIGISHSYLSTLEKGIDPRTNAPIKPTPETLNLISNAYNLNYEQLMELAGYLTADGQQPEPKKLSPKIETIAAHLEDLDDEQIDEVNNFIGYLRSRKK